jgi:four helix bundle protein
MEPAKKFEDLIAWQLSSDLCELVFKLTASGRCLSDPEFCDQIQRASEKAPPLIVEGFVRFTPAEFVRYLRMARGELAEVQSRLLHARTRNYFETDDWQAVWTLARRAMGATTNVLKSKLPLLKRGGRKKRAPRKRR